MFAVGYITRFAFFPAPVSLVAIDNAEFSVIFPSGKRDRIVPRPTQAFLDGSVWFHKFDNAIPIRDGCIGFAFTANEVCIGPRADVVERIKQELEKSELIPHNRTRLVEFLQNTAD